MLIRFVVENYLSFREKQVFSMIPGKGSLRPHHKSDKIKGISALKAGLIYGANASGKSNLVKAIDFGRRLVLHGTKPDQLITSDFFKLDDAFSQQPAYFDFTVQHKDKNYSYGFIVSKKEVVDEWLYDVGAKTEKLLFERSQTTDFNLKGILVGNSKEEQQFLQFTAKGTPRNQLFLTHVRNNNIGDNVSKVDDLFAIIDWFQNALTVIYPDSKSIGNRFELLEETDLKNTYREMLEHFGTGICGVEFQDVDFEKIDMPSGLREDVLQDLTNRTSEKTKVFLSDPRNDKYYVISKVEDGIGAQVLKTKHKKADGSYILFDIKDESDGTRRIMDLIPFVLDFFKGENVFVIDEIERSLHPNLVRDLFELLLEKCDGINSQLIVSSHEATLLNQNVFRKDEIWFALKNKQGATQLLSLEDYNVRYDKDIMKDYLLGRYRAVPQLGNRDALTVLPNTKTQNA